MIYYIFYNPESKKYECESKNDFHEIRNYARMRGVDGFKVVSHKECRSKKEALKFSKTAVCFYENT